LNTLFNRRQTFAADGVEIRIAVLSVEQIDAIRGEVDIDHEILRRTGILHLEKKFASIADVAADGAVLSMRRHCSAARRDLSGRCSLTRRRSGLCVVVAAGDAVIMLPLILHSSLKSRRKTHRCLVHLENFPRESHGLESRLKPVSPTQRTDL
jgi:hypothetical protein